MWRFNPLDIWIFISFTYLKQGTLFRFNINIHAFSLSTLQKYTISPLLSLSLSLSLSLCERMHMYIHLLKPPFLYFCSTSSTLYKHVCFVKNCHVAQNASIRSEIYRVVLRFFRGAYCSSVSRLLPACNHCIDILIRCPYVFFHWSWGAYNIT